MIQIDILLFGKPNEERDRYESSLRGRGFHVLTCDDQAIAAQLVEHAGVRLIIVHEPSESADLEAFLHHKQETRPRLPVFFTGGHDAAQRQLASGRFGVIPLPTGVPAAALAQLLQSFVEPREPAASTIDRHQLIILQRTAFSPVFQHAKQEFEAEYILRALERERGNVSRTARALGMARRNLQLKIRAYGIAVDPMRGYKTVTG